MKTLHHLPIETNIWTGWSLTCCGAWIGNVCSSAGLKAWVMDGRVGSGRFLPSSSVRHFQPVLLPVTSLIVPVLKQHLLRNWKIHKWVSTENSQSTASARGGFWLNSENLPSLRTRVILCWLSELRTAWGLGTEGQECHPELFDWCPTWHHLRAVWSHQQLALAGLLVVAAVNRTENRFSSQNWIYRNMGSRACLKALLIYLA